MNQCLFQENYALKCATGVKDELRCYDANCSGLLGKEVALIASKSKIKCDGYSQIVGTAEIVESTPFDLKTEEGIQSLWEESKKGRFHYPEDLESISDAQSLASKILSSDLMVKTVRRRGMPPKKVFRTVLYRWSLRNTTLFHSRVLFPMKIGPVVKVIVEGVDWELTERLNFKTQ